MYHHLLGFFCWSHYSVGDLGMLFSRGVRFTPKLWDRAMGWGKYLNNTRQEKGIEKLSYFLEECSGVLLLCRRLCLVDFLEVSQWFWDGISRRDLRLCWLGLCQSWLRADPATGCCALSIPGKARGPALLSSFPAGSSIWLRNQCAAM